MTITRLRGVARVAYPDYENAAVGAERRQVPGQLEAGRPGCRQEAGDEQRGTVWPQSGRQLGRGQPAAGRPLTVPYATTEVAAFLKDRRQTLYAALVSVHITMLGFALATLTVVLGYAQSPRFQVLRDSPWFAALFGVFTAALRVLALAFAAALAGLLFDRDDARSPC